MKLASSGKTIKVYNFILFLKNHFLCTMIGASRRLKKFVVVMNQISKKM